MRYLVFLSVLVFGLLSSCEKETYTPQIEEEVAMEVSARAEEDCRFNDEIIQRIQFEHCGTLYNFQGELRIMNNGNIHRIQALGRCHKWGHPDLGADADIEVLVWGKAHIWCQIPVNTFQPTVYNSNLVNGQIPSQDNCHDCAREIVNIEYRKNITLTDDDFLRARIRIKMDNCDDIYQNTMFLTL